MLFKDCDLKAGLLKSVESAGYKLATPIQEKVIKIAASGKNIVWQSQTWTGKTAAFLLPILNKIDTNNKNLQALILAPTRELANQIGDEIRNLSKYYGVTYACLFGGASPFIQKKNLRKRPAIIVATPGRLMDFINQRVVNIKKIDYFILDEVDRMLDMWFVRDIEKIRNQMENVKQTFTFSATMNSKMKDIIRKHVPEYEFIKVGEAVTVDKINHSYMPVEHEHKLHNVIKLLKTHKNDKTIIFTHTKRNTNTLQKVLNIDGFNAWMLNGDMSQNKRQSTLNAFKAGKIKVLVTTDVAARWLNMDNVGLVINFEVPVDAPSYIHRIGRTGRAGAEGKAIMLVSPLENTLLRDIEKLHKTKVKVSEHSAEYDQNNQYKHIRLNRSTDKIGKKRLRSGTGNKNSRYNKKPASRSATRKSQDEKADGFTLTRWSKKQEKKLYNSSRTHSSNERRDRSSDKERSADSYGHKTVKKAKRQSTQKGSFKGYGKNKRK